MLRNVTYVLIFSLVLSSTSFAEEAETPTSIDGIKVVSAQEAKALADEGAVLVDARKKIEFMEQHIKGAVLVSYKGKSENKPDFDLSKDRFKLEEAIPHKAKKIVFYCNGIKCWKSYKAAIHAKHLGYQNVYWFRGGVPGWKEAGYPFE